MTANPARPATPSGPYLATNRKLRTALLCLLYFAQGFPWGFATVALLSALSEAGHPKEKTAVVTALAIMPWTFKFFWAPMIDSFRLPAMGIRRPWIVLAQLGMAGTLFGVWSTGALADESAIMTIAWVFFAHNCFASLQDVATDAMAVDLIENDERGRVNGMMWASKLAGVAVGGAGLGLVIARYSIRAAVLAQAIAVLAILVLVLCVRERPGEKLLPWTSGSAQTALTQQVAGGVFGVVRELVRAMSLRATLLAGLVAVAVPLCEGLFVPLTTQLYVQDFGWGAERFSEAQGTFGVLGELAGALLGGVLCDRFGRRRMAKLGLVLVSAVLLTFALTSSDWHGETYPRILLLPAFKGTFAFTTVCMFSLYMHISWTGAAACQFTLYMALNNVGHMLGAGLNRMNTWAIFEGAPLETWHFYLVGGLLALVPIVGLSFLDPASVERRKGEELAATAVSSSSPEG